MARVFILLALGCSVALLEAQEESLATPHQEVAINLSVGRSSLPPSAGNQTSYGVLVDSTTNFSRHFGLTAEFGQHYHCVAGCGAANDVARNRVLSFAAGPRLAFPSAHHFVPWTHALAGISTVRFSEDLGFKTSSTGAAVIAGGGVDWVAQRWSVRIAEADYVRQNALAPHANGFRLVFGVGLRLGRIVGPAGPGGGR